MGVLLLAGAVALAFFKVNGPDASAGIRPDAHDKQGIAYAKAPRLPLIAARIRFEAKTALFVDVRSRKAYAAAHIPNAVSLPLADLEGRHQELPRDAEILTYCS